MSRYLDYKATIWFRIPIETEEVFNKVVKMMEDGKLPAEIYNDLLVENEIGSCEILYDTEEYISPDENQEQATTEIYSGDDNGNQECVWNNSGIKDERIEGQFGIKADIKKDSITFHKDGKEEKYLYMDGQLREIVSNHLPSQNQVSDMPIKYSFMSYYETAVKHLRRVANGQ